MRARLPAVLLLLPLLAGACAVSIDASTLGVPAALASGPTRTEGKHFALTSRAVFLFWGAVPLSKPSVDRMLAGQLVGARQVTDVKVRVHSKASDVIIAVLTGGLVVPRAVTVEGTIPAAP